MTRLVIIEALTFAAFLLAAYAILVVFGAAGGPLQPWGP